MDLNTINSLFDNLFPINRTLMGNGYDESLKILSKFIDFKYKEYKTDYKAFDWEVPCEWEIIEGELIDPNGNIICDVKKNYLSVINYSDSFIGKICFDELKKHLFFDKKNPNGVPYVTSYYKKNWGFCITYNEFIKMSKGDYHVNIKSKFKKGKIVIGESILKGRTKREILLSSYLCHPSLANNELSGPIVLTYLYYNLKKLNLNYTYRFIINPETIGSLCYLSSNFQNLKDNVVGGIVLTCLGGPKQKLSYKTSKNNNSILDKFFIRKKSEKKIKLREFDAYGGSDERQYNSNMIDLPVGQIARTVYGEYKEYHNSNDTKEFMNINQLNKSCEEILKLILEFDGQDIYYNTKGYGELHLGNKGLYPTINSQGNKINDSYITNPKMQKILMNLLCFSDSKHSLEDISLKINENLEDVKHVNNILLSKNLLIKI